MLYHYIKIAFRDLWKHKVQPVFVFSGQVSDKILPNVNYIQSFNMKFFIILFFLLSINVLLFGQPISGTVFETNSEIPVEYVNIGIVGKNVGTVSDQTGKYTLQIDPEYHNDTLRFSCIGFHSYSVRVSDFINLNNGNVFLEQRSYGLSEVVIRPKKVKQKTLGVTTRNKKMVGCFGKYPKFSELPPETREFIESQTKEFREALGMDKDERGREMGMMMKNRNTVFLKEVNIQIASCTFDTVFLRVNIYKAQKELQLENILPKPVYINLLKEEVKDKITVDLRHHNLAVEGDFLVTLETLEIFGNRKSSLCIFANLFGSRSYFRMVSQGTWERKVGLSISVEVDVEKR